MLNNAIQNSSHPKPNYEIVYCPSPPGIGVSGYMKC